MTNKCLECGFEYNSGILGFDECPKCGGYANNRLHKERQIAKKEEYEAGISNQFINAMHQFGYHDFHFIYLYRYHNFKLYLDDVTKIIYVGFHSSGDMIGTNMFSLSPWYSANGKIQKFIDGKIVEID